MTGADPSAASRSNVATSTLHILSGKPHALALADEPCGAERRPQGEQSLPEAVPGLVVGRQSLGFLERQGHRPRSESCAEFPEQGKGETRHPH